MDKFARDVITELNKFRTNPKYVQHQCEIIRTGFSRLRAGDPFLTEIDVFVKELDSLKPLKTLEFNDVLAEAAKKELPNFRGSTSYQRYKRTSALKGIVPDFYLAANPALCADDGAEEPINVLTKILLNKLDKYKEGRKILCDPTFTQIGIAHEVFDEENMVVMIFSQKHVEPIKKTKNDFVKNIQYRETKDIKNPKHQASVYHRIKGDIFGGEFGTISYEMLASAEQRPKLQVKPQKLKGNKSDLKMPVKTTTTTSTTKTTNFRQRTPLTSTAKTEKVQETKVGRRNDGTSSRTQTKFESKTTTSGLRGKPNESSVTTKTMTRTVVKPGNEKKSELSSTTTKTSKRFRSGGGDTASETRETRTVIKIEKESTTIESAVEPSGPSIRKKYAKRRFGK